MTKEKIKKILKFIAIEIVLFILVILTLEIISYFILLNKYQSAMDAHHQVTGQTLAIKYMRGYQFTEEEYKRKFRPVEYRKSSKRPIILFGCSFTEGTFIKVNETFSRKLADFTNRTVYNRGLCSTGPSFVLQQLRWKDFKQDIPDAEYVIYTYIDYQVRRVLKWRLDPFTRVFFMKYKYRNGKLVEDMPSFMPMHSLLTSIVLDETTENSKIIWRQDELLFALLMQEIKKTTDRLYPNSKFIVLVYQDRNFENQYPDLLKKIEEMGYTMVYTNDLIGNNTELIKEKYYSGDHFHPSSEAWDLIVPKLSKKINL